MAAICAYRPAGVDVKLPFAMTGAKTTAGKGVLQMTKVVADILRLVAEPWGGPCRHSSELTLFKHCELHHTLFSK
jgi:hypothetical protein